MWGVMAVGGKKEVDLVHLEFLHGQPALAFQFASHEVQFQISCPRLIQASISVFPRRIVQILQVDSL